MDTGYRCIADTMYCGYQHPHGIRNTGYSIHVTWVLARSLPPAQMTAKGRTTRLYSSSRCMSRHLSELDPSWAMAGTVEPVWLRSLQPGTSKGSTWKRAGSELHDPGSMTICRTSICNISPACSPRSSSGLGSSGAMSGMVEPAWLGSLRPMSPFERASTRKRFPEKQDEAWTDPFREHFRTGPSREVGRRRRVH